MIGAFGLTEPDYGSNPGGMVTRARRDGGEWVLNGAKMWITNGSIADISVVWAKDEDGLIRGFLVEKDRPGFSAPEMKHKMSLRASVTSELVLQDVRVPEREPAPRRGGPEGAARLPDPGALRHRVGSDRRGHGLLSRAPSSTRGRASSSGARSARFQLTQAKLADMVTEITKAQAARACGSASSRTEGSSPSVTSRWPSATTSPWRWTSRARARDVLGANGITTEYPIMRHMMNLESVKTYEGTHDIHTLILGQEITGIPAFA